MEYLASAVIVVSSNPHVGPSPRTEIIFPLLSICTDELLSTPKIVVFLRSFGSEKNKKCFMVKSAFKSFDYVSDSQTINKFTTFIEVKVTLSYFQQLPLNSTRIF